MQRLLWPSRLRLKDNIKQDFREFGCEAVDWFELAEGTSHWREFVKTLMIHGLL
jgi:hypothetical protein